jgi:hypothetical protein
VNLAHHVVELKHEDRALDGPPANEAAHVPAIAVLVCLQRRLENSILAMFGHKRHGGIERRTVGMVLKHAELSPLPFYKQGPCQFFYPLWNLSAAANHNP